MNKLFGANSKLPKFLQKSCIWVDKNSPDILTYAGVAGSIAGAVMASSATTKLEPELDEIKAEVEEVERKWKESDDKYTKNDYVKDLFKVYSKGMWRLIKLYGPAILTEGASVAAILSAHGIMKKRHSASVAAAAAVETAFSKYRERVALEQGEETDKDYITSSKRVTVKTDEVDSETGKPIKKQVRVFKKDGEFNNLYPYMYEYSYETSSTWESSPEYNNDTIRNARNYCQLLLDSRGYLFLEEVLDALHIRPQYRDPVKEHLCGWVSLPDGDPRQIGDRIVDFGICEGYLEGRDINEAFREGITPDAMLIFNCAGNIIDHIVPFGRA